MKYWNKDKGVRDRHWIKIKHPGHLKMMATNGGWVSYISDELTPNSLKRWCQLHESTGRFYFQSEISTWLFERKEDATWFSLRWL